MMKRIYTIYVVELTFIVCCFHSAAQYTKFETITIDIPGLPEGAVPLEMVLIPAGEFMMGSPEDEWGRSQNEGPQHKVTISKSFYLGKYEVTRGQFSALLSDHRFSERYSEPAVLNYIVQDMSWDDCQLFIEQLNILGVGIYRLPTEAEWEYACRAGSTTRFSFGDALECKDGSVGTNDAYYCEIMDPYMWWFGNLPDYGAKKVGYKKPNPWGLHDMHGNGLEWCQDWYGPYSAEPQIDPTGPETGEDRVLRGGCWGNAAYRCRSAYRRYGDPSQGSSPNCFRVAMSFPTTSVDCYSRDALMRVEFSGATASENGVTISGAGIGTPLANVTFGSIPADNAFEGATDGWGAIVQAEPGEGIMIRSPIVMTKNAALIRCSVRADTPYASIYLASIDQGENAFVSTITPSNGAFFLDRYQRLSEFFIPPSNGFQPIVQVVNTSQTEPLTVYLDNLEAIDLGPERINIALEEIIGCPFVPTPTPLPTPTPTPTPDLGRESGETITVNLPGLPADAKPLEMVFIKAGTFMMDSPSSEQDRRYYETQHQVNITMDFYIGKYEITQAQWKAVMDSNPFNDNFGKYGLGHNYPVYYVSWDDCQSFILNLNQMDRGTFRLPTEAEWEYVCRAGTETRYYWGDDLNNTQIDDYAWYQDNNNNPYGTKEVGIKLSNPWGLFDICGNVQEWCQDDFGRYFYSVSPKNNPVNTYPDDDKVLRGGHWNSDTSDCRSADRDQNSNHPEKNRYVGFRIVRTP